jgi:hypothetical protein
LRSGTCFRDEQVQEKCSTPAFTIPDVLADQLRLFFRLLENLPTHPSTPFLPGIHLLLRENG